MSIKKSLLAAHLVQVAFQQSKGTSMSNETRTATDHPATASTGRENAEQGECDAALRAAPAGPDFSKFATYDEWSRAVEAWALAAWNYKHGVETRFRAEGGNTKPDSSPAPATGGELDVEAERRELVRRLEIEHAMLERERMKNAHLLDVLMRVYSLAPRGEDIKLPDGRVFRFNDPNAAETLNALGRAIHAIPEQAAKAMAAPSNNSPVGAKEQE